MNEPTTDPATDPAAEFAPREALDTALPGIRRSPKDQGPVQWIVRRPDLDLREVLEEAQLDVELGMVGDNWSRKPSSSTPDGSPHPNKQITLMNTRVITAIAGRKERWTLAGDQLYADLDLSLDNLPPGTRLCVGEALLEVSPEPHNGCAKFIERFGQDAMRFVHSPRGQELRLRGLNARVVRGGRVRVGDRIHRA